MYSFNDDADALGAFYFDLFSDLQRQLLEFEDVSKYVDNLSHFLKTQYLA